MIKYLVLLFLVLTPHIYGEEYDPITVYLTWQRSPETTMSVQWITPPDRTDDEIEYRKLNEQQWKKAIGSHTPMPQEEPYLIHRLELTELEPATIYEFRTGEDGKVFKFQTAPSDPNAPIRFVEGGDLYHGGVDIFEKTCKLAASTNPLFAIIGGDIAYAIPKLGESKKLRNKRWLQFLISWKNTMVTENGLMIPVLPAIGNHDTFGKYGQTPVEAPFFYALFPFPGPQGYNFLDFGKNLTLIFLDTGHTHPIYGDQAHWLYHVLEDHEHFPHKFAVYHVPAWPSIRRSDNKISVQVRLHWVPLFEKFFLSEAFEHHDHAYKRTPPIYKGTINNEKGTVYLGDGAWGVKKARGSKDFRKKWYLEKTAKERHFYQVTVTGKERKFLAINTDGVIFDTLQQQAGEPARISIK